MEKTNIKFMLWYIKTGRYIYLILIVAALILTFVQILEGKYNIFIIIFDIVWTLAGVILESIHVSYRQQGTVYVETDKREDRYDLAEYNKEDKNYYVAESAGEYTVKLSGEDYIKTYKKGEVDLEVNLNIERPVLAVTTTERTSKPADNEYSVFALKEDKIKIERPKIIIRSRAEDIKKNEE